MYLKRGKERWKERGKIRREKDYDIIGDILNIS
jgi:hypothetical protein